MRTLVVLLTSVVAFGCTETVSVFDEPVALVEGAASFELFNLTSEHDLGYVALTASIAPLVLLAPCSSWPKIAPGESAVIEHEDVVGYDGPGTDTATIHWCALRNGDPVVAGTLEAQL